MIDTGWRLDAVENLQLYTRKCIYNPLLQLELPLLRLEGTSEDQTRGSVMFAVQRVQVGH